MLTFRINLPPVAAVPEAKDIAKRTLTIAVAGGATQTATITDIQANTAVADDTGAAFQGNHQDSVSARLVDTDAAGNDSPAREETFTLLDNIAPPQPGEFALEVTGQV